MPIEIQEINVRGEIHVGLLAGLVGLCSEKVPTLSLQHVPCRPTGRAGGSTL